MRVHPDTPFDTGVPSLSTTKDQDVGRPRGEDGVSRSDRQDSVAVT